MGISGQIIWRQTGNFLRKQKIIRKITYYESGLQGNKLSFKVGKTKSLLIASIQKQKHFLESSEKLALEIRGRDIEDIKYLGVVYIGHTLNWKKQIPLGILSYSKHLFQFGTLKTLYTSITKPHFRYCCSVVGKRQLTDCKNCKIEVLES